MLKRTKTFVPRVNNKEESPYKPEAFESRLNSNLSHIFAHKDLLTITTLQRFLSAQMHTAS